jgi:hypothetical protein
MDEGARAGLVCELDTEPLAGSEADARTSVRAGEPEDPGLPAIHLEHARSSHEALRSGGRGLRHDGQHNSGKGGAKKITAGDGLAHGRLVPSS